MNALSGRVESLSPTVPVSHAAISELAARVVFPFLVFGTALVQQPTTAPFMLGQVLLWAAILAAVVVVLDIEKSGQLLFFAIVPLLGLRLANAALGGVPLLTAAYELANGLLFAAAGATIIARRTAMIERQIYVFLVACIPVMILQLYGKPAWMHAWRTDVHGDPTTGRELVTTLFERDVDVSFATIQARPAGLLHANNFLSIVLVLAMALLFARSRENRVSKLDIALLAVMVLAMAKIVYLAFLVFSLIHLVTGPAARRIRVAKLWGVLGVFLLTYYLFFPAVFLYDLSPNNALLNYALRVADLKAVLTGASLVDVSIVGLGGAQLQLAGLEAGTQSGYASIAKYLKVLVPLLLVLIPLYVHRLRALRSRDPALATIALHGLVAIVLAPLITSFFGNPFLAFVLGAAAIPLLSSPSPRGG